MKIITIEFENQTYKCRVLDTKDKEGCIIIPNSLEEKVEPVWDSINKRDIFYSDEQKEIYMMTTGSIPDEDIETMSDEDLIGYLCGMQPELEDTFY